MMKFRHGAIVVFVFVVGCGKSDSKGSASSASTASAGELFGKRPVPPGDLAKIKPGMTQAEVKAVLPSAKPTPNHSGSPSLTIDSGRSGVDYGIGFYSDIDQVASIDVRVASDPRLVERLTQAWGAPNETTALGPTWIDDQLGYEIRVQEMGRKTDVSFKPFEPLTVAYFGAKPSAFDALAKIRFGMTRDEVTKTVPGLEGAPKGGGSYVPFNGKPKGVTMSVAFGSEDTVARMELTMPGRGEALLTMAWGPPKVATARPNESPTHCWDTADGAMRIELTPGSDPLTVTFWPKGGGFCNVP